jgi:hypothetical protein
MSEMNNFTPEGKRLALKLSEIGSRNYKRDGVLPVIERGSPQWQAWIDWRKERGLPNSFWHVCDRYTVPMEYPPHDVDGELQRIGGGRLKERLAV